METIALSAETTAEIKTIFMCQEARAPALARARARERIAKLEKIGRYLTQSEHYQKLCAALHADLRKPEAEVVASESGVVLGHINYIRRHLRRWMENRPATTPLPLAGVRSYIRYEPKGLCLVIAPWNYPFHLAIVPTLYAIAAGNAVTIKPSEMTPSTSAFVKKMIDELFDPSEVAVVEGDAATAQALQEQPYNHIFFTGSPQVGRLVMKAAAKHLASVTLELGGKTPAVIDETANVPLMARRMAWSKSMNAGQTCIAPDYALVHKSALDALVENYRQTIAKLYGGESALVQASPDYCRIVNQRHFKRLENLLDDALAKGARIAAGGQRDAADLFFAPTLLLDPREDMEIMHEEIFGPILPVLTFRDLKEVPAIIRRRPKPLAMYIGSRRRKNIKYLLDHTSAGSTNINEFMLGTSNPGLPFGGVNNSGIGKSNGFHSFVEFSNERGVMRRHWGTLSPIYPPYNATKTKLLQFFYRRLM